MSTYKHIDLTVAVNNATTEREHREAQLKLDGYYEAIRDGFGSTVVGRMIMECDCYYINQGIDRPMCGGVWLDWHPAETCPHLQTTNEESENG